MPGPCRRRWSSPPGSVTPQRAAPKGKRNLSIPRLPSLLFTGNSWWPRAPAHLLRSTSWFHWQIVVGVMSLCDSTEKDSYNTWHKSFFFLNQWNKKQQEKSLFKQKAKVGKSNISQFLNIFESFLLLKAPPSPQPISTFPSPNTDSLQRKGPQIPPSRQF